MLASTITMIEARPYMGFGLATFRLSIRSTHPWISGDRESCAQRLAEWAADGAYPLACYCCGLRFCAFESSRLTLGIGIFAVFVHSVVDFPWRTHC